MMEQKYKIHFSYLFAILITIIILLVTVKWSQVPNLAQLISFALTLSSLNPCRAGHSLCGLFKFVAIRKRFNFE